MSIQALRERLNSQKAEARKLLDDKGSTTWTAEDKAKFDSLVDEAERTEQQIEAHQRLLDDRAEKDFNDLPKADPKAKKSASMQAAEIYMRTMSRDLTAEQVALIKNTMSTTTGSEGGFTVKSDVASSVIEAIASYAGIREVASRIVTAQGNPLSYPSSDGRTEEGEIIAENNPATDADMAFGTVPLNVFKYSSKVIAIPIELLQDTTVDIVALLNKRVRDRIGRIQNRMMTAAGTGTGSPFALVTAASVGKVGATGQTTTVTYDDLIDLIDSIDEGYGEDGKRFMFGQTVRRTVRKIKDTAGRPIWTPSYDLGMSARTPDLLLGYPVQINNHMPAPAANAKCIAFGDLGQYQIRDAMDVTLFRFEDSAYLKKGQIGFLAWSRSGGNLLDTNAVKVYQNSAT
jgi:HK97 family phage major capsid protein